VKRYVLWSSPHTVLRRLTRIKVPTESIGLCEIIKAQPKTKRSQGAAHTLRRFREGPIQERSRTSPASPPVDDILSQKTKSEMNSHTHPVNHWIQKGSWSRKYFRKYNHLRKHLRQKSSFEEVKHEDWFQEQFEDNKYEDWFKEEYGQESIMSRLLARQKSVSSLHRKSSESGLATPSNQQPREGKKAKYTT
jgi:hypothetical protein